MTQNLLLLHGALGSKKQLEPLKYAMGEDFKVWAMNFEGHGGDTSSAYFSMDLFAENVNAFMVDNEIQTTHIFGYSMGGYVALTLADKYPQQIQSITTLGTKFEWTPESAQREVKMLNPEIIEQKLPQFAKKQEQLYSPSDWRSVMHRTAQMMLDLGNGHCLSENILSSIKIPVTIGIGNQDKMVSIEESKNAAASLANSKLQILEGFEHPIEKANFSALKEYILQSIKS